MITANFIAGQHSSEGDDFFRVINPERQRALPEDFPVATAEELNLACSAAEEAWRIYRSVSGAKKAAFLRQIATNIEGLGKDLVSRAMLESGLPHGRIEGERGRTCAQLRLFADLVEEGSWVSAVIDAAMTDADAPRVDVRKMYRALGPVAVFGASNFPLAFSTAGGDTASALAAGCPVIVKGHPAHAGTHSLVAAAITDAVRSSGLPPGTFSALHGDIEIGQRLVEHPAIKAVGFTGSERGGLSLMQTAARRNEPIPVYAEMGSVNPTFLLPEKVESDTEGLATTLAASVNLGAGQFCTNPGVLVLAPTESDEAFIEALTKAFAELPAAIMLNEGINKNYETLRSAVAANEGITKHYFGSTDRRWAGQPTLVSTSAENFAANPNLHREVFGPFTLLIRCQTEAELLNVASSLRGQLTCTIMGSEQELRSGKALASILSEKAGRLICNGVPTGVDVGFAMHHGGPFPAASSVKYTSVGADAILRFVRPLCLQNMPAFMLPDELKNENPLGIWRTVNGELTNAKG